LAETTKNRAANPAYAEAFERASIFTEGYWTGARAETWYLEFLIVDPLHQRKGLGRKLVRYGLELADEEGVCASVIASEAGDGLYVSCGFVAVGWMQEGEGNPLRDIPHHGRILFREPTSK
jgi:GNAT superfamily N-acetyltransferase